jgi:streptogramin lyase
MERPSILTYHHGFHDTMRRVGFVDGNDDVWVAHSVYGNSVGHLRNNGTLVGTVSVDSGPTGVAIDAVGKVWATNYYSHTLSRLDPDGNGGVGALDKTVYLGDGSYPYNYGDMTGSTDIAAPNTGSWTVTHSTGGAAAPTSIAWNADVPVGSVLKVEVNNDGSVWKEVTNGEDISELTGPSIYVRVLFERPSGVNSPVLYDLSILSNKPPTARCKDITVRTASDYCVATIAADQINNASFDPDGPIASLMLDKEEPFNAGTTTTVTLTVTDNHGDKATCTPQVTVEDKESAVHHLANNNCCEC